MVSLQVPCLLKRGLGELLEDADLGASFNEEAAEVSRAPCWIPKTCQLS